MDYSEFLHRCDPPDDPDWPAPEDPEELAELLTRLPHWAAVVAAVTAPEMILWRWVADPMVPQLGNRYREAPQKAIQRVWDWVNSEATENQVRYAATNATGAADRARQLYLDSAARRPLGPLAPLGWGRGAQILARAARLQGDNISRVASSAADAAYAIVDRRHYADFRLSRARSAVTVAYAAGDTPPARTPWEAPSQNPLWIEARTEFLKDWWRLVRCRIAVRLGEEDPWFTGLEIEE